MDLAGKNILVTGACGFIGSHLVERLVEVCGQVRAFVFYNSFNRWGWLDTLPKEKMEHVEIVSGDVRDYQCVKESMEGIDVVFHLAALISIPYSYRAAKSYVDTNISGTLNVLQATRDSGGIKVIHTSTSEVYGSAMYVPIDEKHPLQGQSPYSASKIGADKMVEAFHCAYQLPVVTVRPFNTFGPRQSDRAVIPTIISQAIAAEEIHLGNMSPTRDLTYVGDTVEGFLKAAEHPDAVGDTINIGSGKEISIADLAKTIMELVGRKIPIHCDDQRVRPLTSEVDRLWADNRKALHLLKWKPSYDLREGLAETIEWIRENSNCFRPGFYSL